jgi:hypothetical protein
VKIPKDFSHQDHGPVICETVAEIIDQLRRLPPDLPVLQGFSEGARLIVYNVSSDAHLSFEDVD